MQTVISGRVVSFTARDYDFVPRGESERVQGLTRIMWVLQADGAAPDPVKFRDADALEFEKARGSLKFGDQTSLVVDARASIGFVAWAEPTAAVKTRSA